MSTEGNFIYIVSFYYPRGGFEGFDRFFKLNEEISNKVPANMEILAFRRFRDSFDVVLNNISNIVDFDQMLSKRRKTFMKYLEKYNPYYSNKAKVIRGANRAYFLEGKMIDWRFRTPKPEEYSNLSSSECWSMRIIDVEFVRELEQQRSTFEKSLKDDEAQTTFELPDVNGEVFLEITISKRKLN